MAFMARFCEYNEIFSMIRSGQTIVTAMAASEPIGFYSRFHEYINSLNQISIFCANPSQNYPIFAKEYGERVKITVMFLTQAVRKSLSTGVVQYFPHHLSRWSSAIMARNPIDWFWGSCSPPDERGFVSLGLSACYEPEMVRSARNVVLEVNPNMPVTYGATIISSNDVDFFLKCDTKLPGLEIKHDLTERDNTIAQYVADLVPNGATIQLGIGAIPQAIGMALEDKRNLGVHTELLNDAMMHLYQKGVIDGTCKTLWPGKMVAAFAFGSSDLYRFVDRNPLIEFHPASIVNDPYRIGRNSAMISINSAVEVDLTGQVCSESVGHLQLSGVGGASDTHVGAQRSKGGRGIIALHSVTCDEQASKIVFELNPGAKVSVSRNDIDTVITEFGVAQLFGRSVAERARAMISLAHPKFREKLTEQARSCGYI